MAILEKTLKDFTYKVVLGKVPVGDGECYVENKDLIDIMMLRRRLFMSDLFSTKFELNECDKEDYSFEQFKDCSVEDLESVNVELLRSLIGSVTKEDAERLKAEVIRSREEDWS